MRSIICILNNMFKPITRTSVYRQICIAYLSKLWLSVYNNIIGFASFRDKFKVFLNNFYLVVDVLDEFFIYVTSKKILVVY